MLMIFPLFQAILVSLALAMVFAWLSIRFAMRVHLIDQPDSAPHKKHDRPTPLAGGIAILLALLGSEWVLGQFWDRSIRTTYIAGAVVFLFGLWDDFTNIRPLMKLSGQVIAAVILIYSGIYIRIFESPEFFVQLDHTISLYLDWLLTVFWVVGITNAFNFVDSMDGLAVGLGAMAAAFFALVTLESRQLALSLHSALIVGACIGLYLFNSPPAKLFIGDSGAQTLGFILAVLAIVYSPQGANQSSSWFVPILLLGVPIFDATLVVVSRLRRKRPVYSASRDHTYHRLLNLGLEPFRAVLVMHITALSLGCISFIMLSQPPLVANLVFAAVVLFGGLCLAWMDRPENWAHFSQET